MNTKYKSKSTSKSKLLKTTNTNNIKSISVKSNSVAHSNRQKSKLTQQLKDKTHITKITSTTTNNNVVCSNNNEQQLNTSTVLNLSDTNIKANLLKDGIYYLHESNTLKQYIMQYYTKHNVYPKTKVNFYKFGRLIGKGAFGKVNIGLHVLTGKIVAIKSFNKQNLKSQESKAKIFEEVNLMKKLRHNSLVKILETIETDKYILIIMENIAGGDLSNFIKKRTKLNEKTSKIIFKQLIKSLKYLHSKNIIHRDIKLDNILIDLNNTIKLCDFGISQKILDTNDKLTDKCGTPAYIAPEILSADRCGYEGPPVDLWSSGVVLYAMLSGTVPFKANNLNDLHNLIIKGTFDEIQDISKDATHLVHALLETNPKKRITLDKVLEHPWLNNTNDIGDNMGPSFFTKAENVLLSKANVDYRESPKEEMIENFTSKNLYTENDNENKNVRTKSIILAPFNSTILSINQSFRDVSLSIENSAMQFNSKTKALNRNYELHNNSEIDHGVLINHSNHNNNNNNNNNVNKQDVINHNNNNDNMNNINNNNEHNKYSPQDDEEEHNNHTPMGETNGVGDGNKKLSEGEFSSKKESHRNVVSLITYSNTFVIDENILGLLEQFGYKRDYVTKCLNNNEFNYATASYYLLSKYNNVGSGNVGVNGSSNNNRDNISGV